MARKQIKSKERVAKANNKNTDEHQKSIIIGDIVRCYVETGSGEKANNYYIDARKKYGKGIIGVKMLTYIASLLEYHKDYANAKKYATETSQHEVRSTNGMVAGENLSADKNRRRVRQTENLKNQRSPYLKETNLKQQPWRSVENKFKSQ